jgi:hypothetical protein
MDAGLGYVQRSKFRKDVASLLGKKNDFGVKVAFSL